ncbi:MAG: signal transduction histidine kinase [Verrucomicrobiales bacterium]|jgi:signal transduction histidine kinase
MSSNDPIPHVLHQLAGLTQQMQQHAALLPAHTAEFGDEHIGYVVDTSANILGKIQNLMQSCLNTVASGSIAPNPMANKDVRHDMRNLIAVVKGFSELMQMDAAPDHPLYNTFSTLRTLSDQFVALLDDIKASSDDVSMAAAAG